MSMSEMIAREVRRGLAGTRSAWRGLLSSLQRGTQVQLAALEGLPGEQLKGIELFQHFGFTSAPPSGSQLIMAPLGGRTSATVIVASEHGSYRFVLGADGEACVYNQWGDHVHLRADRSIRMVAQAKVVIETDELELVAASSVTITTAQMTVNASAGVQLTTPAVTASGDITAGGDVGDTAGAKTMAGMRGVFDAHTHTETNAPTNLTSAPGTSM